MARQEAERRKAAKSSTRVLTNQDLPKVPARVPPAASDVPPDATAAAEKLDTPAVPPPPETVEKNEAWWRVRVGERRDTLRRDEILFDALQARVNGLSSELFTRVDPLQRARADDDRRKALLEMERVRGEIEGSKKAIGEIEEEARRAGVPPGWLR